MYSELDEDNKELINVKDQLAQRDGELTNCNQDRIDRAFGNELVEILFDDNPTALMVAANKGR